MHLIRSMFGRRQFIITLMSSVMTIACKRIAKAVNLIFPTDRVEAAEKQDAHQVKVIRAVVVYYSATGSTGKIARAIHRGMKSVMKCDVAPVNRIDPKKMDKYDLVAVGGPIWYFRETANLRLFINSMPRMDGKLCIPFCTHGRAPSGYFYSLAQLISKKAFTVIGWQDWYGACSHVLHMPKPYYTDGHPDEIDLREAETFGREMAERSLRIFAGETRLIPEIPSGPDADSLWISYGIGRENTGSNAFGDTAPAANREGGENVYAGEGREPSAPSANDLTTLPSSPAVEEGKAQVFLTNNDMKFALAALMAQGGRPSMKPITTFPTIDTGKCIHPRCSACADICPFGAIDFSLTAPAAAVSGSRIFVNEGGCAQCSFPFCQAACPYDAVIYTSRKTRHAIDTTKCTYPKCTLCSDKCPMNSIDLTKNPPAFHNNCEGGDLCWCICPEDAIYIPNLLEHQHANSLKPRDFSKENIGTLLKHEAEGRFRFLVPIDQVGKEYSAVLWNPNAPRVTLHEEDYPYEVEEG